MQRRRSCAGLARRWGGRPGMRPRCGGKAQQQPDQACLPRLPPPGPRCARRDVEVRRSTLTRPARWRAGSGCFLAQLALPRHPPGSDAALVGDADGRVQQVHRAFDGRRERWYMAGHLPARCVMGHRRRWVSTPAPSTRRPAGRGIKPAAVHQGGGEASQDGRGSPAMALLTAISGIGLAVAVEASSMWAFSRPSVAKLL